MKESALSLLESLVVCISLRNVFEPSRNVVNFVESFFLLALRSLRSSCCAACCRHWFQKTHSNEVMTACR